MVKSLISGLVGACALTATNEVLRRHVPNAPRLDIAGTRGLALLARETGYEVPGRLRQTALAGDLASNAAYFSLSALAGPKHSTLVGALLGFAAGAGAVYFPGQVGIGDGPTARTKETAALTMLYYTLGGATAGAAYCAMARD